MERADFVSQVSKPSQAEQQQLRHVADGLQSLLNQWDPIGLVGADGPTDEYECLVWPVVRLLREGVSAEVLAEHLTKELQSHFGLEPQACAPGEFAVSVKRWFETA